VNALHDEDGVAQVKLERVLARLIKTGQPIAAVKSIDARLRDEDLRAFTRSLVSGVRRNRPELGAVAHTLAKCSLAAAGVGVAQPLAGRVVSPRPRVPGGSVTASRLVASGWITVLSWSRVPPRVAWIAASATVMVSSRVLVLVIVFPFDTVNWN
jgi:hypothetical protein